MKVEMMKMIVKMKVTKVIIHDFDGKVTARMY